MERQGAVLDTDDAINACRIGGLQITVAVLGALILLVDGFNTQVIGYIAPRIAKDWSLSRDVLGWVLAADKVGLLIGYLFVAPLSGYYGHKRVSIACIVLFGLLAWLTTTAGNVPELFTLRLLTGIGLGGALPSGVVLTGEYFPKAWRSTSITFIYCGLSAGQLSAGEVSNLVLGPFGWQGALWVGGGLALALALTLMAALPESLEYLVNRGGRPEQATKILGRIAPDLKIAPDTRLVAGARNGASLTIWQLLPQLFQHGRTFGTLVFWIALGMNLTVNTSLQVWLTKILVDAGFDQHVAIIATEASFAAGIIGAFIIGPLMDRFGPYRVMSLLFLFGALFSVFLGLSLSWSAAILIAASSFGSGFCTSGVQKGGNALSVHFYPVALRSTGLGWGLGIGRIGAIVGPLAVGYLLTSGWSSSAVFLAMAIPMLVGASVIVAMGRVYGSARRRPRGLSPTATGTGESLNETDMNTSSAVVDTDALVNETKIGKTQLLVGLLGACALFVEGFDTSVIGYIAPQITRLWHVPNDTLGTILTADMVGLLLGYLFVAPLSARFGHKRMVAACTAAFGLMTFLTVSSTDVAMLIGFRFLTGIGVGGAMPSAVALTGEYFPERVRSTSITLIYIGFSVGQIGAGVVAGLLLEPYSWHAVLAFGGIVTLALAALFQFALPESLEYLINRGNDRVRAVRILARLAPQLAISETTRLTAGQQGGRKVAVRQLLEEGRAPGTVFVWIGMFMNLMIYFFLQKWLTSLLVQVGLSQSAAITATTVGLAGGILAAFIIGPLMDRFGPYAVVAGLFVASALSVAAMASVLNAPETLTIVLVSFAVGFCLSGGQKANNALSVYFYPTALRGTGLGWSLGVGRIGGVLGPFLAGQLLISGWSPSHLFYAAAGPMVLGAVAIALMGQYYGHGDGKGRLAHGQKA